MTQYKALKGRLIVKDLSTERVSASGIIIGDTKNKRFHKCEVISCGGDFHNGKKTIKAPCKNGDIIYIRKMTTQPMRVRADRIWLITFEDVLAVKDNPSQPATNPAP